jgi:hypothetical protein
MEMRKIARAASITGCLVATLIIAAGPVARASGQHRLDSGPPGPCALARMPDETVENFSVRMITCATDTWSVPGGADRATCIATRESGLNPRASSPTGAYLGLFQHSAKYWPSRYDTWTRPAWELRRTAFSARTNAIVTMRMVHSAGRWLSAGWPPGDC